MLRNARKAAGLSQSELAERLGVHMVTVSNWERGLKAPGRDMIAKAEEALGLPVGHFRPENSPTAQLNEALRKVSESPALPRQLRIMAAEFELEALRLGAEEPEMDYIRTALTSPEAARMFAYGHVSRDNVSDDALKADYESLIAALRSYVEMRVNQRNKEKRQP